MEIIGKVLAKINSIEHREKAKKVLGSIVEKSEVRSSYYILHELWLSQKKHFLSSSLICHYHCQNMGSVMGLLGDKMVKNKKVFGSNIEDILKVR